MRELQSAGVPATLKHFAGYPASRAGRNMAPMESVILLANAGRILPLGKTAKVAVTGPLADDPLAFFGC